MHNKLKIIYQNNKPYGIRDETGFLFMFAKVSKYFGQEERYRQEVQAQFALADYLLVSLRARDLTTGAVDLLHACACGDLIPADEYRCLNCQREPANH